MADIPHVALIVETSSHYGRQVLTGVTNYLRAHAPWSVFLEQRELWTSPPAWLKSWRGDGVISRKTTLALARMLHGRGIPVVDLNDRIKPTTAVAPRIESDDRAIGAVAADHLLERGFTRCAFCGFSDQAWSVQRRVGFAERLRQRGSACDIWESAWTGHAARKWEAEQTRIAEWIASLPHPVGMMACNDVRGQHVLDACQRAQVAVPEQVAVIGVDDDAVLCNLCRPPLSSVIPNAERVGYEAAALLDEMMANRAHPRPFPSAVHVLPIGVHVRQSTDVLAIDDPDVTAALKYIRECACSPCSVEDVLQQVPLSRSGIERRFRQLLGHSLKAEIRAVQLKRVRELLADTDLPLSRIATLAGFDHTEYLSVVFKREMGMTPGRYRAKLSAGAMKATNPPVARGNGVLGKRLFTATQQEL